MSRKVLLASMHVGGGHAALRDSFAQVLTRVDPERRRFEPAIWDSRDTHISSFYNFVVHHVPWFQSVVFGSSNLNWAIRLGTINPLLYREAEEVLVRERPDIVLSTHLVLAMMFARVRHRLKLPTQVVMAVPDYGIATKAFFPEQPDLRCDWAIVMDEVTQLHLLRGRGLPSHQVHWSGFLTRPAFQAAATRGTDEARAALKPLREAHPELQRLDPSRPTLLFLGGSAWTEKTRPVLERLFADPALLFRLNAVVVCGKNEMFRAWMDRAALAQPRVSVLGFVRPELMAQLMTLADVPVLGSLAPATMQELLETGCGPLMLFHFIPGAERAHVEHIERHRIGLYEPDPAAMVERLKEVTGLVPAGPHVAPLLQGFRSRAAAIRSANVARAMKLPEFLDQILGREPELATVLPLRRPA